MPRRARDLDRVEQREARVHLEERLEEHQLKPVHCFSNLVLAAGGKDAVLKALQEVPENVKHDSALLVVERGTITATCRQRLGALREPEDVHNAVTRFLHEEHARLAANAGRGQDGSDSDDDDAPVSYCGRPGCRAYPHQHDAGAVLRDGGVLS